jgi:hypothetical protein
MVYIYKEFDTERAAETFRKRYYQTYPPMGYGTHIAIESPKKPGDKWILRGSRETMRTSGQQT